MSRSIQYFPAEFQLYDGRHCICNRDRLQSCRLDFFPPSTLNWNEAFNPRLRSKVQISVALLYPRRHVNQIYWGIPNWCYIKWWGLPPPLGLKRQYWYLNTNIFYKWMVMIYSIPVSDIYIRSQDVISRSKRNFHGRFFSKFFTMNIREEGEKKFLIASEAHAARH